MKVVPKRVIILDEPRTVAALGHPVRLRILDQLREPDSAAGIARQLGQARQNVTYHLKELEDVGLVGRVGERRRGNFVETLYQTAASTFLVSPRVAWSDPRRLEALRQQVSLESLVGLGERLVGDATALLDRAAFDGEEIASAAVETEVHLKDEAERATFLKEYLTAIGPLLKKYGRRRGARYRVALAAYPDPEEKE